MFQGETRKPAFNDDGNIENDRIVELFYRQYTTFRDSCQVWNSGQVQSDSGEAQEWSTRSKDVSPVGKDQHNSAFEWSGQSQGNAVDERGSAKDPGIRGQAKSGPVRPEASRGEIE